MKVNQSRRPDRISRLLTLTEACLRFGVQPHRIYEAAALDLIHPVQPNGRILYPEWELAAALRAGNPVRFVLGHASVIAA